MKLAKITSVLAKLPVVGAMALLLLSSTPSSAQNFASDGRSPLPYNELAQNSSDCTTTPEQEIHHALRAIDSATQLNSPAVVCVEIYDGKLNVVLFTKDGTFKASKLPQVSLDRFRSSIDTLHQEIADFHNSDRDDYLKPAQELYQWILEPLEAKLVESRVDSLIFSLHGLGISALHLEVLHDGEQFLVQKYNLAQLLKLDDVVKMSQELSNNQLDLDNIESAKVLVMGTSSVESIESEERDEPTFSKQIDWILGRWLQANSDSLRNREFSVDNIEEILSRQQFEILHLATHARFNLSNPNDSFIQLWDSQMKLTDFANLLRDNPVKLLVLSACQTAFGDGEDNLGLAELANQAGAKTVVASQWRANQLASLVIMTEFHEQLREQRLHSLMPLRGINISEALRQAQIDAIEGNIAIENGQIVMNGRPVRSGLYQDLTIDRDLPLDHPYFWATFTLVGNPIYLPISER